MTAPSGSIAVSAFVWGYYWPYMKQILSESSRVADYYRVKQIASHWQHTQLKRVKAQDIDFWWAGIRGKHAPGTANKYLFLARGIFTLAQRWGYRDDHPASHVKKLREPRGRVKWLTDAQRVALLEAAD